MTTTKTIICWRCQRRDHANCLVESISHPKKQVREQWVTETIQHVCRCATCHPKTDA